MQITGISGLLLIVNFACQSQIYSLLNPLTVDLFSILFGCALLVKYNCKLAFPFGSSERHIPWLHSELWGQTGLLGAWLLFWDTKINYTCSLNLFVDFVVRTGVGCIMSGRSTNLIFLFLLRHCKGVRMLNWPRMLVIIMNKWHLNVIPDVTFKTHLKSKRNKNKWLINAI